MVAAAVAVLCCAIAVGACSEDPAPSPEPDATAAREIDDIELHLGLKPGPGREHVAANCLPCHSGAIIVANHLTRDGWSDVIDQMQKKNGMPVVAPEVRSGILDYLEAAQRPEDAGLSAGKQSPWAAPLYRPNPLWR